MASTLCLPAHHRHFVCRCQSSQVAGWERQRQSLRKETPVPGANETKTDMLQKPHIGVAQVCKNQTLFWQKKIFNCRRLAAYKLAAFFLDPSQLFFSKGWPWVEAIKSSFPLGRRAGRAHSCMTPFPPTVPPPHPTPYQPAAWSVSQHTQPARSQCTWAALSSSPLPVSTLNAAFC